MQQTKKFFLAGVFVIAASASASTLRVPAQFPTIQAAINAAAPGDSIAVAPGVYGSGIDFGGKRVVVTSDSGASLTYLDLSVGGGTAVKAATGEPIGTSISGFTIRGCTSSAVVVGPASALSISNCKFLNCSASIPTSSGGAIRASGGNLTVSDTTFTSCSSTASSASTTAQGGAIFADAGASATIFRCDFSSCSATLTYTGTLGSMAVTARGGAISSVASSVSVNNSSFDGCFVKCERTEYSGADYQEVYAFGGAIDAVGPGTISISGSTIGQASPCYAAAIGRRGCSGNNSGGRGARYTTTESRAGAIAISDAQVSIAGTTMSGNYANASEGTNGDPGYPCAQQTQSYAGSVVKSFGGQLWISTNGGSSSFQLNQVTTSGGYAGAGEFGGPWGFGCVVGTGISFSTKGGTAMFAPGTSGGMISSCSFVGGSQPSAVWCDGGFSVNISGTEFRDSDGFALETTNNCLISSCKFKNGHASPMLFSGSGAGPVVYSSLFCANSPNQPSGAWIDAGSNSFASNCPACPGDFNGNGVVAGDDLGLLLSYWGTPAGDLDGDGTTNGADLGILLNAWGPCTN